jgi:hypothetical protein
LAPLIASASLSLKKYEPMFMRAAMNRKSRAVLEPPIKKPIATNRPERVANRMVVLSPAPNVDRLVVVITGFSWPNGQVKYRGGCANRP